MLCHVYLGCLISSMLNNNNCNIDDYCRGHSSSSSSDYLYHYYIISIIISLVLVPLVHVCLAFVVVVFIVIVVTKKKRLVMMTLKSLVQGLPPCATRGHNTLRLEQINSCMRSTAQTLTQRCQRGSSAVNIDRNLFTCTIDNNNNRTERCYLRFLQSPHCAPNCLQHVRSSGQGAVMCKSHTAHRALITCSMSCATWYKGTAQLLNLTKLKSHLF